MSLTPFVAMGIFVVITLYAQLVMWVMWDRGICGCKRERIHGGLLILLSLFIFYLGWDACKVMKVNEYVIGVYSLTYFFGIPIIGKFVLKDLLDLIFGKKG